MSLINQFNQVFPVFAAQAIQGQNCVIHERQNEGQGHTFCTMTFQQFNGWQFPADLPKTLTSIYNMSQEGMSQFEKYHDVLRHDCDGVLCVEEQDRWVLYVVELKSAFSSESITKAKDQIVGSCLKVMSLFRHLQAYVSKSMIEVQGVIVAYEATTEALNAISKLNDSRGAFCTRLNADNFYKMPQTRCEKFWNPLLMPGDIAIAYVPVPKGQPTYTMDFSVLETMFRR